MNNSSSGKVLGKPPTMCGNSWIGVQLRVNQRGKKARYFKLGQFLHAVCLAAWPISTRYVFGSLVDSYTLYVQLQCWSAANSIARSVARSMNL